VRLSEIDWELHRPRGQRRLIIAIIAVLVALGGWGTHELQSSVIAYRGAQTHLEQAMSVLSRARQTSRPLDSRTSSPTAADASTAAALLQSDWPDRMLELERCVIEPARLVRLQIQTFEQETSAFIAVTVGSPLQQVLECLNAGSPTGAWSVAEVKTSNQQVEGNVSQSTGRVVSVRLRWKK